MKNLIVAIVFGISIIGLTGTAFSQAKIGFISTEELIGSMPEAEKANAELQEYQTALQSSSLSPVGLCILRVQGMPAVG